MPSPVGHALGGALVAVALTPRGTWRTGRPLETIVAACRTPLVMTAAVAACLPDLDFAWGRHNMETHSLGAAVAAGLLTWVVARGPTRGRMAVVVALAWATHVLFDWLGSDDTAPIGVMALWPWTSSFYFADAYVFAAISRRYWLPGFWRHNLMAVVKEAVMLAPLLAAVVLGRLRRERASTSPHAQVR